MGNIEPWMSGMTIAKPRISLFQQTGILQLSKEFR